MGTLLSHWATIYLDLFFQTFNQQSLIIFHSSIFFFSLERDFLNRIVTLKIPLLKLKIWWEIKAFLLSASEKKHTCLILLDLCTFEGQIGRIFLCFILEAPHYWNNWYQRATWETLGWNSKLIGGHLIVVLFL